MGREYQEEVLNRAADEKLSAAVCETEAAFIGQAAATVKLERAGVKIYADGDRWCVLLGDDLQSGVAGFGKTRQSAVMDFWQNYLNAEPPKHSVQEAHDER